MSILEKYNKALEQKDEASLQDISRHLPHPVFWQVSATYEPVAGQV